MSRAKPEHERNNTNPLVFESVPLTWDGERRGPELPDGYNWCERTLEWWEMWRTSPQAMVMLPTDWEVMRETAYMHNMLWGKHMAIDTKTGIICEVGVTPTQMTSLGAEIRRRMAAYGATYEDRGKLRMKIKTDHTEAAHAKQIELDAKNAVDYAEMLTKEASKHREE